MNHTALRYCQVARGVYFYPNFLMPAKEDTLIRTTIQLWNNIYQKEIKHQDYTEPLLMLDSNRPFLGLRTIGKDHENILFRGSKNIPFYVKTLLISSLYDILVNQRTIPHLTQASQRLFTNQCNLDIGVNFYDTEFPQKRDFSFGSLTEEKTSMMVYAYGPAALTYLHVTSNEVPKPIPIPANTMVLFTKKVMEPKEKFYLPHFCEEIKPGELSSESDITKVLFTVRF